MNNEVNPIYHEIDFVVPVHRFKINFSYSKERGIRSFIREFVLRLVHISPMKPANIAIFFGLSNIEMSEAISDLINRGDLELSNDGELVLTHASKNYFQELGDSPILPTIIDNHVSLWYELNSFNCIRKKYDESGWGSCIELSIDNEVVSNSPKNIKSIFQKNFYKYFEENRILKNESDRIGKQPNIYSVGEINRISRAPLRLTTQFQIDQDGRPVERKDSDLFSDPSVIHELITEHICKIQKIDNFEDIVIDAVTIFDDDLTLDLVKPSSIDVEGYILAILLSISNNEATTPLIGPIYSENNWNRVMENISNIGGKVEKNHKPIELIWIAPSDPFWGKSYRLNGCISELLRNEQTNGKKSQRIYNSNIYIQIEKHYDRRMINDYKHEFKDFKSGIYGLIEGFLNGNVEIILIPGKFVAVVYHFSMPDLLPVTIPTGFTSTNKSKIKLVESVVDKYIGSIEESNNENNLGLISSLSV
ncbi:hypothetical protein HN615_17160 [Candidatus Woesearchaeota archaeon]|jgi:hypothetical protein|nr:hypothetical protein [Candidatus Woesearchaeota archaeon]